MNLTNSNLQIIMQRITIITSLFLLNEIVKQKLFGSLNREVFFSILNLDKDPRSMRGKIKSKRTILVSIDKFKSLTNEECISLLRIKKDEFKVIINCLQELITPKYTKGIDFKNQVLICFLFIIQYYNIKTLSFIFKKSHFIISSILDYLLPTFGKFFQYFIPNQRVSNLTSEISEKIRFIIDNTLHKTHKSHFGNEGEENYSYYYKSHGVISQLLIDYDGIIVSYATNIPGSTHDSLVAFYNPLFEEIIGDDYALGDPGFNGVPYVIPGYKRNHLPKDELHKTFDHQTRREQVLIENVNHILKQNVSINKKTPFIHSRDKLVACIVSCIGLYNLKKSWGYYSQITNERLQ